MEPVPPKEVWKLQPPRAQKWSPVTQVANRVTSGTAQSSQPVAVNQLQATGGTTHPLGPIMKVKNFRLNIVFASSVTVLWGLVYVPEGLPIGTLNTGSVVASPADSLYEPQQFLIASGIYSSAASNSGTNAGPLKSGLHSPGISIRAMGSSLSGEPSRTSQESKPSLLSTTRAV